MHQRLCFWGRGAPGGVSYRSKQVQTSPRTGQTLSGSEEPYDEVGIGLGLLPSGNGRGWMDDMKYNNQSLKYVLKHTYSSHMENISALYPCALTGCTHTHIHTHTRTRTVDHSNVRHQRKNLLPSEVRPSQQWNSMCRCDVCKSCSPRTATNKSFWTLYGKYLLFMLQRDMDSWRLQWRQHRLPNKQTNTDMVQKPHKPHTTSLK